MRRLSQAEQLPLIRRHSIRRTHRQFFSYRKAKTGTSPFIYGPVVIFMPEKWVNSRYSPLAQKRQDADSCRKPAYKRRPSRTHPCADTKTACGPSVQGNSRDNNPQGNHRPADGGAETTAFRNESSDQQGCGPIRILLHQTTAAPFQKRGRHIHARMAPPKSAIKTLKSRR